jgi:3-deoxy-D-manno-octulosonic-acid transferase
MKYIYSISVLLYKFIIQIASLFNTKASLRTKGVKETFSKLKSFQSNETIWVHCASLGEFEQGRPLIEKIKSSRRQVKIVLSFFSPSGYEIRKNYEFADLVIYLPYDTKQNAKKLIKLMKPDTVFFIKYEFWYWYINEIHKNNIPLYLISGIFRKNQIFFKFYGKFFIGILNKFSHLFLQNKQSKLLTESIQIKHSTITGDTRFDRVRQISETRRQLDIIASFKSDKTLWIAGSTWKPDEELIFDFIKKNENGIKLIIVPHEIEKENIERIIKLSNKKTLKYSEANSENVTQVDVLIIDNIGMLSSLYAYADFAYIGGGFGKGIHNTLEAAVYGIPVIFGPNYQKFDEAKELISRKAAFSIHSKADFLMTIEKLIKDVEYRKTAGKQSELYVQENIGATEKILHQLNLL